MAITTRDNVVAIAPELAPILIGDPRWSVFIADAALEIDVGAMGSDAKAEQVARYYVAHRMTMSAKNGASGQLSSVTVGPVTRTYKTEGTSAGEASALTETTYGREFLRLIRLYGPRMAVI